MQYGPDPKGSGSEQPGKDGPLLFHGAFGAELLAAEAVNAGPPIDHRQVIPEDNGLGRTDFGTGAAADAVGPADGGMRADGPLDHRTAQTAQRPAAAAEQQAALALYTSEVRDDQMFPRA